MDELVLVFDQNLVEEVRVVEVYQVVGINSLVNAAAAVNLRRNQRPSALATAVELLLIRGFAVGRFQLGHLARAYLLPAISS